MKEQSLRWSCEDNMRPGLHTNRWPDSTRSGLDTLLVRSHSQLNQTPPAIEQPATSTGPTSPETQRTLGGLTASSVNGEVTYQMMILDAENNPIQIPVNMQATSKVANEKRKRNATASRRFRQRRKEEERRNSQTIAQLEQQIRQLEEEKEYFRKERDYFRQITFRNPGQARLLPQPISPLLHASLGETQCLDIKSLPSHLFDAPSGDEGLEDGACKEVLGSFESLLRP